MQRERDDRQGTYRLRVLLQCYSDTVTMTGTVNASENQPLICRIRLPQFNETSSEGNPQTDL